MAVLQQKSGSAPLSVYQLGTDSTRIGRQADCEVYLASLDVSRYHARIFRIRGRYVVEDLQSRNGTQVNGQTIAAPVTLEDGDEIQVSSMQFAFLAEDPLLADSSLSGSGYAPSLISLSSGSTAGRSDSLPLMVSQGDQIPVGLFGLHELNPNRVLARVSLGHAKGGWPTLRQAEDKLHLAMRLQGRLRGAVHQAGLLSQVLEGLFDLFEGAQRIAVVLRSPIGGGFAVEAAGSRAADDEVRICVPLLHCAMESAESVLCVEQENPTSELDTPPPDLVVRYLMGAALLDANRNVLGAVQIETCQSGGFEPLHAECLAILSHVIACRLDDCLAVQAEVGQTLLDRSTEAAVRLRQQIVPTGQPQVEGFRICHQVLTVPDVAADLVDYLRLPDGRLACFILDVPGRGPEAAGLMASISHAVNRALMTSGSAAGCIRTVEEDLATRMSDVPMVTSLCVAILDPPRSVVTVAIAGHCPAWQFSKSGVTELSDVGVSGPPLGAPRDVCEDFELYLAEGDALLLCSDGIARIPREDGSLVSQADIGRLLERAGEESRRGLEHRVMREVERLQGESTLQDDIVLLAIYRSDGEDSDLGEQQTDDVRVLQ